MSWGSKFLRGKRNAAKPAEPSQPPLAAPAPPPSSSEPEPTLSLADAEALLAQGAETADADAARATFEQVEASGRLAEWAAFRIGLLEHGRGEDTAADAAFTRAIAHAPGLFWAHYERLALPSVRADRGRRDRYVEAILEIDWEPLRSGHVSELEATAQAVWDDGKRDLAGRLLARLFPSNALSDDSLARIIETALDPALVEAASARHAAMLAGEYAAPDVGLDEQATFDRAVQDFDSGRSAEAAAAFEAVKEAPNLGGWANFYLGRIRSGEGDHGRALEAFDAAVAAEPKLFWAHFERLRLLVSHGGPDRRHRSVEAMLQIQWEPLEAPHVAVLEAAALAVWRDGDRDLSGRLLARLFPSQALGPDSLARIVETASDAALVEAASARRAAVLGGLATGPTSSDAPQTEQSAFDAAVADFNAGRLSAAAAALETLKDSVKLGGWAHFYLGRIYSDEADQSRALAAFDAAVAAEPTLFWAHFERAVLGASLGVADVRLTDYARRIEALAWEPLQPQHVGELEQVGHALYDRGERDAGARLLSRLWPSAELSPHALVRIVERGPSRALQEQAAERLHGRRDELDGTALRVLSEHHQRRGEGEQEIASRERAFALGATDFEAWVGLVRSYAANGERERALATIAQGDPFTAKQRQYAAVTAHVELGEIDEAFLGFRSYCRVHGEAPKYAGIRTAYRLADGFDVARRDEVIGILTANYPDDRDIALVVINAAMRDQRWADARATFEAQFGDGEDQGQDVRLARIDILAFSGELDAAAQLLEAERVDGALPPPFLRSSIRILSEMERWDEVLATGLAQLGDEGSFPQFLAVLVRAARKLDASERLLDALLALPRPLSPERVEAVHAVAEDLAETGQDVLDRIAGIDLPFERRHRIALKLRGEAGPGAVERDLCIYYCADRAYLTPALVSLTSLAMSNISVARRAVIYLVVESDVLERAQVAAAALARRLGLAIEVVDAASIVASTEGLRTGYGLFTGGQQLALAAYYRIFFARWLVEQKRFAQALYVDADTLVRSGLEELFALEQHAPIMARRDDDRPEVRRATALHQLKGAYFNSGILRFALDHPELPALLDRAIAAATDPAVELIFQDQCALNIAFDTQAADLPERFNGFTPPSVSGDGISASEAVIVHFLDRPKPWDGLYRSSAREWFEWFDLVETLRQSGPAD